MTKEQLIKAINHFSKYFTEKISPKINKILTFCNAIILKYWKKITVFLSIVIPALAIILIVAVYIKYKINESYIIISLHQYRDILHGKAILSESHPVQIYARDNTLLGEYIPKKESSISLQNCKQMKWMNLAAVSAEDRYFFEHHGISWRGIFRAFINNLLAFDIKEGGGSLTQQLARNLYTDPNSLKLPRKIYETFIALQIEKEFNKNEILCLYLNKIYMGEGRIGIEEASWFYFRKPPWEMTAAEAAMIAGIFPSPARYSPLNNISFTLKKQSAVFDALIRDGHLTEKIKKREIYNFIKVYDITMKDKSPGTIGIYGANRQFRLNLAPNVNEYAIKFLREVIEESRVNQGGLKIYTTIDPEKQLNALGVVRTYTENLRKEFLKKNKNYPEINRLAKQLNGILLSLDPYTGNILAEVGGYSVDESGSQIDRIRTMRRQPGSTIKGILYAIALDEGVIQPNTVFVDGPINVNGYKPKNWYKDYLGNISLREAIGKSVNTVAVETIHKLGPAKFIDKIGEILNLGYFESKDRFENNLTLGLGSGELSPLELTMLYATILNGGNKITPRIILKITDINENIYWEDTYAIQNDPVLEKISCMVTVDAMQSVVDVNGTAGWIGKKMGKDPSFLPFPVAAKSGTVQTDKILRKKFSPLRGVHDVWFVGLVPGEVSVVWFGQDRGAPFEGSGSGTAGAAWVKYASKMKNVPLYFFEDMATVMEKYTKEAEEKNQQVLEANKLEITESSPNKEIIKPEIKENSTNVNEILDQE